MTTLGVFRDDYYNPINILQDAQYNATTQTSGTLTASVLAGAVENYVKTSAATALTTDTAANIYAQTISAIQAAAPSAQPPPNITGLTFLLYIHNTDGSTLTLTAGTGVTITGTATLATTIQREYLVTITGPTTVTFQDLGGSALS
jgi:hypothetical protein